MPKKSFTTSLAMDRALRHRIDELRLARARASQGVPPPMREVVVTALEEYLHRELRPLT